ncbi:MAG: porin family protein [Emticicia sp.]|uniref:porin family protein n=1 Tax=Emticicia sp. TaxID=1930953 RepID=UPI003BA4A7C6
MKNLKRFTLAIAITLLGFNATQAQTTSIGPLVGVNVSTFTGEPNTKPLAGLAVGGFINHSFDEHFGVNAKLIYSQLGSSYTFNEDINRLHYIQLPVTGVYYFGNNGQTFRPKVYAGLYGASLLSSNHKSGDAVVEGNGTPYYKKSDFGGVLGLGFNYLLSDRTWLNVDAGYNGGFVDVTTSDATDFKNKAFTLNVGISFPIR